MKEYESKRVENIVENSENAIGLGVKTFFAKALLIISHPFKRIVFGGTLESACLYVYKILVILCRELPLFYCCGIEILSIRIFQKQCGKMRLLMTSNFSFSHSVFIPFGELFALFHQI